MLEIILKLKVIPSQIVVILHTHRAGGFPSRARWGAREGVEGWVLNDTFSLIYQYSMLINNRTLIVPILPLINHSQPSLRHRPRSTPEEGAQRRGGREGTNSNNSSSPLINTHCSSTSQRSVITQSLADSSITHPSVLIPPATAQPPVSSPGYRTRPGGDRLMIMCFNCLGVGAIHSTK
jgi:hypothetical protein